MRDDVILLGSCWLPVSGDVATQLDETVFACCEAALRDAGVQRHEVGLSITTSMDLYDARSISNALTAPAAGGYLSDELRVEGDAGSALVIAADSIRARKADIAIVVAINIPEIASADERDLRGLADHISSYTFDPHFDRPVAMTSTASIALHASGAVDRGEITEREMAERTSWDLGRADPSRGAVRTALSAEQVLAARAVATPLTEPMLPALTTAVGAVVLASEPRARRAPRPRARLTGWGSATSGNTWSDGWLDQPAHATRAAAARALRAAGIGQLRPDRTVVTATDLSPALTGPVLDGLGAGDVPVELVNPDGGVRANYPGLANGVLRLLVCVDGLQERTSTSDPWRGLVHTTDNLAGLTSSTANVLVLEPM